MHPVEHDLWGSVPTGGYVACHFVICVPCQTEVQDLRDQRVCVKEQRDEEMLYLFKHPTFDDLPNDILFTLF